MTTIRELADELRAANERGFLDGRRAAYEKMADPIEVRHIPGFADDGPLDRERFLQIGIAADDAFRASLADFRQSDITVAVQGQEILLDRTLRGTFADGAELEVDLHNVYTVSDGRIVQIVTHIDPVEARRDGRMQFFDE